MNKKNIKCVSQNFYDEYHRLLSIKGCALPRPEKIELWAKGNMIGMAELGICRSDISNLSPEFEEKLCGWDYEKQLIDVPEEIIVRYHFKDGDIQEDIIKIIIKECDVVGSINRCEYEQKSKCFEIEGWYLPKPDCVEIWVDNQKIADAQLGILREDVYRNWKNYEDKYSGWSCCLDNLAGKPSNVAAKAIFAGVCRKINETNEVGSIIKGNVNQCYQDKLLEIIQMNGWCIPIPQKIEIWGDKKYLGVAELNIERSDVYSNFPQYREKKSGWQFCMYKVKKSFKEVEIKAIMKDGTEKMWKREVEKRNYKVVSFDLFDTLIVRPTMHPVDIFKLVGIRADIPDYYKEMRIYAEQYARQVKSKDVDDIGIDIIYETFKEIFDFSHEEIERIKQIEIEVEIDCLRPRKSIAKIYNRAVKSEAEVIIMSDMYLPREVIEKILKKNNFTDYNALYVSCDVNAAKGTGKLYNKLTDYYRKCGINPYEILHLGDNLRVDVDIPKSKGWNTFYIPRTMVLFEQNNFLCTYAQNVNQRMDNTFFVGALANYLFDDPFIDYDRDTFFNGDAKNLGIILAAPFILNFTLWMLKDLERKGIEKVFLVYRDGYLIEKIIKIIRKKIKLNIQLVPIYLSRKVRLNNYSQMKNGLFKALMDFKVQPSMTVEEFIKTRLLVEEEMEEVSKLFLIYLEKDKQDTIGDIISILPILSQLENIFNKNAHKNLQIIDGYCMDFLNNIDKAAVFDVGYRGSVIEFLRMRYGKLYDGYHMFSYSFGDKSNSGAVNTRSFIRYGMSLLNSVKILHNIVEDIISVGEGTASKVILKDKKYCIVKEKYNENSKIIETIQQEVLKFVEQFVDILGKDIMELEFERYPEFDLICNFLENPPQKDAEIIASMSFKDSEFIGSYNDNIYKNWYDSKFSK